MKNYYGLSIDHIDPFFDRPKKKHGFSLVCGLHCLENLAEIPLELNVQKSDAFVPYRVKDYSAPIKSGDLCEFWLDGEWRTVPFLGKEWWFEAKELGYSKSGCKNRLPTDGKSSRDTKFFTDGTETIRVHNNDEVPEGFFQGMAYSEKRKHGVNNWITNGEEDRRISSSDLIPDGWKLGRCNGPGFSHINSASKEARVQRAKRANKASQKSLTRDTDGRFKRKD
jgi:hypothetical protein